VAYVDSAPRRSKKVTKQHQEHFINNYESNLSHSRISKFAKGLAGACIPKTCNTTAWQGHKVLDMYALVSIDPLPSFALAVLCLTALPGVKQR